MVTKETKRSLETVDSLKKQIIENQEKIRQMKRADSEINLKMAIDKMDSEDLNEQKELLDACYDYIAQHRAIFKDNFKKLE